MPNFTKLKPGDRFGRLVLIGRSSVMPFWDCRCDCGKIVRKRSDKIVSGNTRSCGCLRREFHRNRHLSHGLSEHPLYAVWHAMWWRCTVPSTNQFEDYGGRGISVCEEWKDVIVFVEWALSHGYESGLTIDRRDNDGNYTPENCRWVTMKVNQSNKKRRGTSVA